MGLHEELGHVLCSIWSLLCTRGRREEEREKERRKGMVKGKQIPNMEIFRKKKKVIYEVGQKLFL
jgi:hypothetical protein